MGGAADFMFHQRYLHLRPAAAPSTADGSVPAGRTLSGELYGLEREVDALEGDAEAFGYDEEFGAAADRLQAKLERLQAKLEGATKDKKKARLQRRIDRVQAKLDKISARAAAKSGASSSTAAAKTTTSARTPPATSSKKASAEEEDPDLAEDFGDDDTLEDAFGAIADEVCGDMFGMDDGGAGAMAAMLAASDFKSALLQSGRDRRASMNPWPEDPSHNSILVETRAEDADDAAAQFARARHVGILKIHDPAGITSYVFAADPPSAEDAARRAGYAIEFSWP